MNKIYKFIRKNKYSKPVELVQPIELSNIQVECLFMDNKKSNLYLCRFKRSILEIEKIFNKIIIIKPEDLDNFKKIFAKTVFESGDSIILTDFINIETYREYYLINRLCDNIV